MSIFGGKRIGIKNCSRDENDPRVTRCEVIIQEGNGVARRGQIDVIGNNKNVIPLRKAGGLSDEDFSDTIRFLNKGNWANIVPNIKSVSEKAEHE